MAAVGCVICDGTAEVTLASLTVETKTFWESLS